MSSSLSEKTNVPLSISPRIVFSPLAIFFWSAAEMMPVFASISECAIDPRISCANSFRSKEIEALIACMIADGPEAKRPPHISLLVLVSLIVVTRRLS